MVDITAELRSRSFRATQGRVRLLELLNAAHTPLSIREIRRRWRGKRVDQATLYRTLTDLAQSGMVRQLDLNSGIVHFEYTPDSPHHHHIVCTSCGRIEDINTCSTEITHTVLRKSSHFKTISSHNLEFFGLCSKCN